MKKVIASAILMLVTAAWAQVDAQTVARETRKEARVERSTAKKEAVNKTKDGIGVLTKDNFYSDFGDVPNVKWSKGKAFDEAYFLKDGKPTTAYYDYTSRLVGTTNIKKFADLPVRAQKEIKKRYPDYVTGAVVMFEDNRANDTKMFMFGTQFEDADHYFVTVTKGQSEIALMVTMDGNVSYFKKIS